MYESNDEFKAALEKETFFDIEDGLQIQCAESAELNFIITQNLKDFINSAVPAIEIADFIQLISAT